MPPKSRYRLGALQLAILKVLWDRGTATVNEMNEALEANHRLAYTTVATMLRKMEARGLVKHDSEGRRFVYRARVAQEDVARGMTSDVLDRLFEGSLAEMVTHLLSTREVSREELKRLEKLIQEKKKRS